MDLFPLPPSGLDPLEANQWVQAYYDYCRETSSFEDDSRLEQERVVSGGIAIAPLDAARCILDTPRTLRFLRGIDRAIAKLRDHFPGEEIRILYAGCGPFAALAQPFLGQPDLRWTCVDTHPIAVETLDRLVRRRGKDTASLELVCADAATLVGRRFHLVIAEVMQRALSKEPQLGLTVRLAPGLEPGGVWIPQSILLHATLADLEREFSPVDESGAVTTERRRIEMGTLLDLNAVDAPAWTEDMGEETLDLGQTVVPDLSSPMQVLVRTEVRIFEELALGDYDSGLTVPRVCRELGSVRGGERVHWRYRLRPTPGITVEVVEGPRGPGD